MGRHTLARQHVESGQQQRWLRYIEKTAECRNGRKQRLGLFAAIGDKDLRTVGCAIENRGIGGFRSEREAREAQEIAGAGIELLYECL